MAWLARLGNGIGALSEFNAAWLAFFLALGHECLGRDVDLLKMALAMTTRNAYMWSSAEIDIVIDESDPPTVLASITTPIGVVELIANIRVVGDTL